MKILVFAPYSEIWVHAFPEALTVEALAQQGHEVVYITCGKAYATSCVPMDMHGVPPAGSASRRAEICDSCTANAAILRKEFGLSGYALAERITAEDRAAAERALAKVDRSNFLELQIDGLPVGRYSLYQLLIRRKLQELEFDEASWAEYRIELRHSLETLMACRRLLDEEAPDRVLVYNGIYSVNHVVCSLAAARGIPSYSLHAGGNLAHRLQKLILCRDHNVKFYEDAIRRWPAFRDQPCPPALMEQITDHFLELLKGRSGFVYSAGKHAGRQNVREILGIPPDRKVLTAALSSPDEMLATRLVGAKEIPNDVLFATQIDWVKALIDFVGRRQDLFLVIRVHPREFPNRREGLKSQHARTLEKVLSSLPPNVCVNWPQQDVSLYALAEHTDVFLNAHSTVGKEMSVLGRPVVLYTDRLVFYTPDINYVGSTYQEYFAQVERALADGWSDRHIREAYRWYAVEYGYALVDISDSYQRRESAARGLGERVVSRVARLVDAKFEQKRDCRRRATRLAAAPLIDAVVRGGKESALEARVSSPGGASSEHQELDSLRREIRRIITALYGSGAVPQPGSLHAKLHNFAQP